MSTFSGMKASVFLIVLPVLVACDGVRVGPTDVEKGDSTLNQGSESNNVGSHSSGNANTPQNGLTFANGDLEIAPRIGLNEHLNNGINVSFDQLQTTIFGSKCANCHTGGSDELPGSMDFSHAEATYASLIDVTSTEYPQLSLVSPGMSTNSYLVRKIEGTQLVGKQMPLQGGPLSTDEILSVKAWIDSGAEP